MFFFFFFFCSTPPRVYRQVASLVGLQLVTSFIGAAKILGAQRQTTQRQLTAEKKKNSEHVESLNKRLSETHEKITMIEEMMRKIFTGYYFYVVAKTGKHLWAPTFCADESINFVFAFLNLKKRPFLTDQGI